MLRLFFISLLMFFISCFTTKSQEVIGLHADSIKVIMNENLPEFVLNTTSTNKVYNYLKYEDHTGTQTMLFFLTDNDICRYFKRICDYSLYSNIVGYLNENFENTNDTLWTSETDQGELQKVLKKEDWFFTIVTRLK